MEAVTLTGCREFAMQLPPAAYGGPIRHLDPPVGVRVWVPRMRQAWTNSTAKPTPGSTSPLMSATATSAAARARCGSGLAQSRLRVGDDPSLRVTDRSYRAASVSGRLGSHGELQLVFRDVHHSNLTLIAAAATGKVGRHGDISVTAAP